MANNSSKVYTPWAEAMIPANEVAKTINHWRNDAVVVTASKAMRQWNMVSGQRELDVNLHDCPDRVAAVGLGISLARPDLKVIIFDNDAALRINPSTMATVGSLEPQNFVHIILEDGTHQSTDGIPVPGLDVLDFVGLAKIYGYRQAYRFDQTEELALSIEDILLSRGPTLISVRVYYEATLARPPDGSTSESFNRVKTELLAR